MKRIISITVLLLATASMVYAQSALTLRVNSQRFEGGEMIYNRDNGAVWVISEASNRWWRYSSSTYTRWEDNPYQNAPGDRIAPINAFGRIWGRQTTVRDELKWAVLPEIGLSMQAVDTGDVLYLERLDGRVYRLDDDGTWTWAQTLPAGRTAQIDAFNITEQVVSPGQSITVGWRISGDAENAELRVTDERAIPIFASYRMPLNGTQTVSIPVEAQGEIRVSLAAVTVKPNPGSTLPSIFRLASEEITLQVDSSDGVGQVQAAFQQFESGFMIWRADTDMVLSFDNAELPIDYDGGFSMYPEAHYAQLPAFMGDVPGDFVAPKNAFGKVWNINGLSERFGYPTAPEQAYTLTVEVSGTNTHYTLPNGRTVETTVGGGYWRYTE